MNRLRTPALALATLALTAIGFASAEDKPAPKELTFETKMGAVTFTHQKHVETAAKGDCKICHETLFKQDKAVPLGYKDGMHKPAEAAKSSCAACHHAGGSAFESKANCARCHQKKS